MKSVARIAPGYFVCIGAGPGPKNVLWEYEDGTKTVVPYAIYKHKLKPLQLGRR